MNAYLLNLQDGSPEGPVYSFRGARGRQAWPMRGGARLGSCGIWNFLWRLGIHARDCTLERLPDPNGAILFASADSEALRPRLPVLRQWIDGGGYVVATGEATAWIDTLGWSRESWTSAVSHHPYSGMAWVMPQRSAELLAPPRWPFSVCKASMSARSIGTLHTVGGERQTPHRAIVTSLETPAVVAGERYCFINGHPFAAFQAWLQGQEDLQPWLAWRHRSFWLDEWVASMAGVLSELPALPAELPRPGIAGLGSTTVILRHDLDHSRDVAYLEEEAKRGFPATHGVLKDGNTAFWRDTLEQHPDHECAFHYNTGVRDWLREADSRLHGKGAAPLRASKGDVAGEGLLRQVRWAQSQQVGVSSLHRHLFFQPYPEWVDALDHVFANEPSVLGASSMFRAQVLRWGSEQVDGAAATVGEWPDPQFPYWLPYKLAHAGKQGARLLGWESASVMEAEPEFVDQLLSHRVPHVRQRVITLGYHPAHAHGTTFHAQGSLASFTKVLDVIASRQAGVERAERVFALAHAAIASA